MCTGLLTEQLLFHCGWALGDIEEERVVRLENATGPCLQRASYAKLRSLGLSGSMVSVRHLLF